MLFYLRISKEKKDETIQKNVNVCLCVQNGSIMEGLALWKNNVDKRFEGIEDCMICFSVIHGSNYSLPKKACRTCKKKFHSACLVRFMCQNHITSSGGLSRCSVPSLQMLKRTIYIDEVKKSLINHHNRERIIALATNGSLPIYAQSGTMMIHKDFSSYWDLIGGIIHKSTAHSLH